VNIGGKYKMNEKTFAAAENALADFLRKNLQELNYYRGRIIKSKVVKRADPQMVSAAVKKINWHKIQIHELEGELDLLKEEISQEDSTNEQEGQNGEEEN
jgi:hypothetical protein